MSPPEHCLPLWGQAESSVGTFYLESVLQAHRSAQDVWRGHCFRFAVAWAHERGLKEAKRLKLTVFSKDYLGNLSVTFPGSFSA